MKEQNQKCIYGLSLQHNRGSSALQQLRDPMATQDRSLRCHIKVGKLSGINPNSPTHTPAKHFSHFN